MNAWKLRFSLYGLTEIPAGVKEALLCCGAAAKSGRWRRLLFSGTLLSRERAVDPVVGLPVDTSFAFECFRTSPTLESAIGMFGAMHQEGFEPLAAPLSTPPYHSKRNLGCCIRICCAGAHFCKYLIANAYYYSTAGEFLDITPTNTGAKNSTNGINMNGLPPPWAALRGVCGCRPWHRAAQSGRPPAHKRNGAPAKRQRAQNYIHLGQT